MVIGPPDAPMIMTEIITWNEKAGLVRFTFDNDPMKTGHVDNTLTGEDDNLTLTFSFDVHFTDAAPQAMVEGMQKNIQSMAEGAVKKSVGVIEAL